jgi:probable phosphoglycerate mutase
MSARKEAYLVRHGETEWSRSGRHTGRTDIPLTERGREQARAAGRLLDGREIARVLVSPLERARETARLAGFGGTAEVCEDLREFDYGDYEGRTTADIRREAPGWLIWTGPAPGGETLERVATRADRVIERIDSAPGSLVLFAHGHLLRILMARWCGLAPIEGRRFALETATLTVLGWEHEYRTIRLLNGR